MDNLSDVNPEDQKKLIAIVLEGAMKVVDNPNSTGPELVEAYEAARIIYDHLQKHPLGDHTDSTGS